MANSHEECIFFTILMCAAGRNKITVFLNRATAKNLKLNEDQQLHKALCFFSYFYIILIHVKY